MSAERVRCSVTWETSDTEGWHLVVKRHACAKLASHAVPNDRHRCVCGMPHESTDSEVGRG